MKDFRGLPNYGSEFKKNCQGKVLRYSRRTCQLAFNELVQGKKEQELIAKFGERIIQCFNERELNKYGR
ncbi:hypothetical protein HBN50_02390 [Halobacteriovorax sp. GB3]|uniref:hypothetical protein n=1 Tax=Halobacteriovorax sp. GB3 TaxID=2719615 RepID=UPI00235F5788|nr:hypothetical protein [Halobacteriovorax sp. GB3]MDD0851922.1 hypothetical protein [Halobacteriovorax sp. GB3]